jgi:phage terminase Nu1 subunit (DNA packaging protein)
MTTDHPRNIKTASTEQEVDAATLGEFLGITAHAVRILATKEIAIRSGRDRFLLHPSIKNYCGSLRELAKVRSGVGDDSQARLNTEAAALKRATRELVELRRDTLARKLISREDITDAWGAIIRTIRAMVLAIPARCQEKMPHWSFEDIESIRSIVRAILTEASTIMPNNPPLPDEPDAPRQRGRPPGPSTSCRHRADARGR